MGKIPQDRAEPSSHKRVLTPRSVDSEAESHAIELRDVK
jgi:hypothetical protein